MLGAELSTRSQLFTLPRLTAADVTASDLGAQVGIGAARAAGSLELVHQDHEGGEAVLVNRAVQQLVQVVERQVREVAGYRAGVRNAHPDENVAGAVLAGAGLEEALQEARVGLAAHLGERGRDILGTGHRHSVPQRVISPGPGPEEITCY